MMRYIVGQLSTMPSFCHVIARQCDHFCNGCSLSKQVSWHSSSHGDESGLTIGLMYFPMGPTNLWKETKNENVPVGLFLELTNVGLDGRVEVVAFHICSSSCSHAVFVITFPPSISVSTLCSTYGSTGNTDKTHTAPPGNHLTQQAASSSLELLRQHTGSLVHYQNVLGTIRNALMGLRATHHCVFAPSSQLLSFPRELKLISQFLICQGS